MDIEFYNIVLRDMKVYNDKIAQNYGNVIVQFPTKNTTYPHTVFSEIRNVANPNYNSCHDKVASIGYRVDIYAKSKGNVDKQTIARKLAKEIDNYLTNYVGLTQISWNVIELENDSSIYHIIITYSGNLHENRRRII